MHIWPSLQSASVTHSTQRPRDGSQTRPCAQSNDVVQASYGMQLLSMQSAVPSQSTASTHCTHVLEDGSQIVIGG
jgi:hypothetical protein